MVRTNQYGSISNHIVRVADSKPDLIITVTCTVGLMVCILHIEIDWTV